MGSTELLTDAFERIRDGIHPAVNGLSTEQLAFRPDAESNSIAWLAWHLTRIQDERLALPLDPSDTGYGHDPEQVALVVVEARSLLDYFEDVHTATLSYLGTLTEADLDRVVDTRWDPPVTVGVRIISVITDDLQHVGQAAYVRGLVHRRPD